MVLWNPAATHRRWPTVALGSLLIVTLLLLLTLQARWLGELADAQREETRQILNSAAQRIAGELQGTLAVLEGALLQSEQGFDASASPLIAEVFPLADAEIPPPDEPAFVVQAIDGTRWSVLLDRVRLREDLFPALVRSALGESGLETYRVCVVSTARDTSPLYDSHPNSGALHSPADASARVTLVPNRWFDALGATWIAEGGPVFVKTTAEDENIEEALEALSPWRVEIRHRAGSVDIAMARAHRNNLILGGGLLLVLVFGLGFLWVAEQRARRLAEKELAFVAGVSHELRTPLAVLRMAGSNLENGTVSSPQRVNEYGALVEREAKRLGALVDRVLRFSKETTRTPQTSPIDVEGWIQAAIDRCEPWRDRRRFEIEASVDAEAKTVIGEVEALTSLLQNLIENAIKYGDDGQTIRIAANLSDKDSFELTVSNPGQPIPASEHARLFDPFQRGSNAHVGTPGNGLGLSVAREIATAHGGRLELQSGNDVTFVLTLPQ